MPSIANLSVAALVAALLTTSLGAAPSDRSLDPWGDPLPEGRWPAPTSASAPEGGAPVIVVDTTADTVGTDGDCSLREAIDNANAGMDTTAGDCAVATIITFDPSTDGIPILLTGAAEEDSNVSGDLDIAVDLVLVGNGRDLTILDGGENDRVLHVLLSADAFALEGIELRNGWPPEVESQGGGILAGAHTALRDCRLRDNLALEEGGGVQTTSSSDLLLERCEVTGNEAVEGGGVGGSGSAGNLLEIVDCVFSENTASSRGGAVRGRTTDGVTRIAGTTMTGNTSGASSFFAGGAVSWNSTGGLLVVEDTTLADNHADAGWGGGIQVDGFAGTVLLRSVTISGNFAERGAGLHVGGGDSQITIANSTISGNRSSGDGGGIYTASITERVRLVSVTLTGNTADADSDGSGNGGGLFGQDASKVLLDHVLLAGNDDSSLGAEAPDCGDGSGFFRSLGFNLIGDPSGCSITGRTELDLVSVTPGLGPLGDHGGPTATHALLPGSAARDAGDPEGCRGPDLQALPTDQRGVPRPLDGDEDGESRCDIGAFESHPMLPVDGPTCRTSALDIPDGGFAADVLAPQQSQLIDELDVRLIVEHGRTGDLVVELTRGSTTLTLLDRPHAEAGDCTGWHAGLVFDDTAVQAAQSSCVDASTAYVPSGRYSPAQPLSVFGGEEFQGVWTLVVRDEEAGESGRLLGWCLEPGTIFADGFESGDTSAW